MSRRSRAGGKSPKQGRKRSAPKRRNAPNATRNRGASIAGQETVVARITQERDEALLRETANAEILRLISKSPGALEPVFDAILEHATRICEARFGNLFLYDQAQGSFRTVAMHNAPPAYAKVRMQGPIRPPPDTALARLTRTRQVIQIADLRAEPGYIRRDPMFVAGVELAGIRTLLAVPMLREGELVGSINIYRHEVRPFTDEQIALLANFANQAVIAIENARLLNELRQSLEQQTATSEVLQIISSSPGELNPVFEAILENATRICEAKFGNLLLLENGAFRRVALYGAPSAWAHDVARQPVFVPSQLNPIRRMLDAKDLVHVLDMAATDAFAQRDPAVVALVESAGARTIIAVPMLKDNELVGAIAIFRQEVRPFTDKQIELVRNFSAQAVIAIENARLLNELNQLNHQLEQRVTDQVGEIERMSRLRRFLPQQVADLIVASGNEKRLESHRREITALFCDLRGFTGFSESSDPEDVMTLLSDYHAAIGEIIIKYSGTLERYAGDGVMVVFNDPVPVENPALQAVLMALEMRTAIGALIERWRDLGHELGFGIGIAHGFATLGTIGFEGRFDYAAIGTVSNVASRLCDEAKPGQILISPRVRQAVEKAVMVEPVGEFALKGIRRPMAAYNVLAPSTSEPH
jgi:class 3 adenylate cyclase/putative methionine-R-sulfoxide reductase with GAF domain